MKNGKVRVVVTGLGVVSFAGIGISEFRDSMRSGGREASPISIFDVSNFDIQYAKEITGLDAVNQLGKKGLRYLDRSTILSLIATKLAIESRGGEFAEGELKEAGVVLGTAFGGLHSIGTFDRESLENPNYINPMDFPNTVINSPASQVSVRFGMECLNLTISTGQSAGVDAIGYGADRIQSGQEQMLFAGGVEELSLELYAACHKNNLLKKEMNAPGIVLGEGAGIVILEALNENNLNNQSAMAEVIGYGTACDAGFKMNSHEAKGARNAMLHALEDAELTPDCIDAVVTCKNGLKGYDSIEDDALKEVYGEQLTALPLFSTKQVIGETMGASGALQVLFAVLLLKEGDSVHNDWKLKTKDLSKQNRNIEVIMVNAFGCNGVHSSLILKRYENK